MDNSWIRITDDKATWPPANTRVLLYKPEEDRIDIVTTNIDEFPPRGIFHWRPAPKPPELEPEPCPFCGGNNILAFTTVGNSFMYCADCRVEGPRVSGDSGKASRIRALEAWNRRTVNRGG
jgi:Lar family restriction alleviation protein